MICPYCKCGTSFHQVKPNVFKCGACGFKLEIGEDLKIIWVTIKNRTLMFRYAGWFEKK